MSSGAHVTADRIAAYLDGGLSPDDRTELERHLLVCPECRGDLAAASIAAVGRARWPTRIAPLAAAAAALVGLMWVGLPLSRAPSDVDAIRSGPESEAQIQVVSPVDGSTADLATLVFTWRSAASEVHYVFTLTEADGDVVHSASLTDTVFVAPPSVGLEPGRQYFWLVDALMDGARSTTTGFTGFVVR